MSSGFEAESVHAYQLFSADQEPMGFEEVAEYFAAAGWRKMTNYRSVRACALAVIDAIHADIEKKSQRCAGASERQLLRDDGRNHLIEYVKTIGLDNCCGMNAGTLAQSIHDAVLRFAEAGAAAQGRVGLGEQTSALGPGLVNWVCGGPDASERFDRDDQSDLGLAVVDWAVSRLIGAPNSQDVERLRSTLRAVRRWLGSFAGLPPDVFEILDLSCSALDPASPDPALACRTLIGGASRFAECWARLRLSTFLASRKVGELMDQAGRAAREVGGKAPESAAATLGCLSLIASGGWPLPGSMGGSLECIVNGGDGRVLYRDYLHAFTRLLREHGERLGHDTGDASVAQLDALAIAMEVEAGAARKDGDLPLATARGAGLIERVADSAKVSKIRPHSLFLFAALHRIERKRLVAKPGAVVSRFIVSPPHLPGAPIAGGRPVMVIRRPEDR